MTMSHRTTFTQNRFHRACLQAAGQPGTAWLDSSLSLGNRGRASYFCRNPRLDVSIDGYRARVVEPGKPPRQLNAADGLSLLARLWTDSDYFSAGYISYEAALPFISPGLSPRATDTPGMRFLFYDSALEFDTATGAVRATNPDADSYDDLTGNTPLPELTTTDQACLVKARSQSDYLDVVTTIKRHIHEGDIYQANFTTRIEAASDTDPLTVYSRLRTVNPAPYSAWFDFGDYRILSSSPERMFLKDGDRVSTGPIKGTIARGRNADEDCRNTERLLTSDKDRAELLMIVDLARNDLGRIAEIGTVNVDSLYRPEHYASVIHLVADISCRLREGCDTADIIRALMPGGSITGAPKKRAVEIIQSLEDTPRSVYTGCIGYVAGNRADFNIAIRTMVHRDDCYHIHAGGGIVADSDPEAEFTEMRLKASKMFEAVGLTEEHISWPK